MATPRLFLPALALVGALVLSGCASSTPTLAEECRTINDAAGRIAQSLDAVTLNSVEAATVMSDRLNEMNADLRAKRDALVNPELRDGVTRMVDGLQIIARDMAGIAAGGSSAKADAAMARLQLATSDVIALCSDG